MLIVLAASVAFVMLGNEVDAADHDLELELNDTSSLKVIEGSWPEVFNWTLTNNGSAASEIVVIDVIDHPLNWSNLVLWTNVSDTPPFYYLPHDVLVRKGETIDMGLIITAPDNQLNDTYWFTLIAYPKANPDYNVTYDVAIVIPQVADFHLELWNPPPNNTFRAIPPSTVTIRFALYNTGNANDTYLIQGNSSRAEDGWELEFVQGVDEYGYTEEVPPDPLMENPYFIDIKVHIPAGTEANEKAIVALNATSMFNTSAHRSPAMATIWVLQYYNFRVFINGPDKKEGIPGGEVEFQLKINNSGNGWDTFTIKPIWDTELNPGFTASANPRTIDIDKMTTNTIQYIVKVPENAPKKTFFFTAEVSSKSPELAPVTKSFAIEVGQFFRIELTCEEPRRVTDPGGNLEFEMTVRNTGNGLDSIVINEIEGAPVGWLTYTQPPEVTLLQGQDADIKVIIIVPSMFEEAPMMNYTLTIPAVSSRSDAQGSIDLFIDIRQFWRIEWMYGDEEVTSPSGPQAQAGIIRPRPEIALFNETSTTIVLGVRNFGNGPDEVTVEVENSFDKVDIAVTPTSFSLESAVTLDITVTITVPKGHKPGVYAFHLKATSSNGSNRVRIVPIDYLLMPVFIEEDFDDLEFNDTVDDNYLFTFISDGAGGEVLESSGRWHRSSNIDIVSGDAVHDHTSGMVTVTLRCAAEIIDELGTEYCVYFVNGSHQQPEVLLKPWEHTDGPFLWAFSDPSLTLCNMYYGNGQGGSTFDLPGLEVSVEGDTITFIVPSRELRAAGVEPASGFAIYADAHTLTIKDNGDRMEQIDWDTAGRGAPMVPAEFFNELEEETSGMTYLAPLAIALVVIAVLVVVAWRWRGG
jgi:uncharacterized membrane protein